MHQSRFAIPAASPLRSDLRLDALEPRLFLSAAPAAQGLAAPETAAIRGTVWRDRNGDRLRNPGERARANATVYIDSNLNGLLDAGEPTTITNGKGRYAFPGLKPGRHRVGVAAPAGTVQSFPAPPSRFDIQLLFDADIGQAQRPIIARAASFWSSVIIGDIPDFKGVDDLQLRVRAITIDGLDGTLAFGDPTATRPGSRLPYRAEFTVDESDLPVMPQEELYTLALHEIGHGLGFGTSWVERKLIEGAGTRNTRFVGERAIEVYRQLTDNPDAPSIPLENRFGAGTRDSHWRSTDLLLGTEVLSGFISAGAPFSAVTAATMEDLGYVVDITASDITSPFETRPASAGTVVLQKGRAAPLFNVNLAAGNDVRLDFAHTGMSFVRGTVRQERFEGAIPTPVADRRIFLDLNYNRIRDPGEPATLTGGKGRFSFENVTPGFYHVRQLRPSGFSTLLPTLGFHAEPLYLGNILIADFLDRRA